MFPPTSPSSATSTASSSQRMQAAPDLLGEGSATRPRVRNAQLVGDQPGHLRVDDAGRRPPGPAREPGHALHVGREHHEGHPTAVPRRPAGRLRRRRHQGQADAAASSASRDQVLRPGVRLRQLPGHRLQGAAQARAPHPQASSQEVDPNAPVALFQDSQIKLENFYGIEIDDFAHEIAILSLWLAKHQMNVEFRELFGTRSQLIPLRDTGNVRAQTRPVSTGRKPARPGR